MSEKDPGLVRGNMIDRLVGVFSPEAGLRRLQARHALNVVESWNAGSTSRRGMRGWITRQADADSDLLPTLQLQRDRSRDAARNIPIAGGAINTAVTSVIGTGLAVQPEIDHAALGMTEDAAEAWQEQTKREFLLWAESTECDITRHDDFYALQNLVYRSVLESGDVGVNLPFVPRRGTVYDLRIQLVEADRIINKDGVADSPTLTAGVETDANGAVVAYHVAKFHPGQQLMFGARANEWQRIAAFGSKTGRRNFLLPFRRVRPGQTRGIPFLSPVMESIKQLGRYSEAEVMAAVVSGMFTGFLKTERGGFAAGPGVPGLAAETGQQQGDNDLKLGNGIIGVLKPGESMEFANPGRPNSSYEPFILAVANEIGMSLEIPREVLFKVFNTSYSAARAALIEAWKFFRGARGFMVQQFCQPVYEAWLEEAVAIGRVDAPGFFDDPAIRRAYCGTSWHGDAMPQINPDVEINAAIKKVALGVSDLEEQKVELDGGDWRATHRRQVRQAQMRREAGLLPLGSNPISISAAYGDAGTGSGKPPSGKGGNDDGSDDERDEGKDDEQDDGNDGTTRAR